MSNYANVETQDWNNNTSDTEVSSIAVTIPSNTVEGGLLLMVGCDNAGGEAGADHSVSGYTEIVDFKSGPLASTPRISAHYKTASATDEANAGSGTVSLALGHSDQCIAFLLFIPDADLAAVLDGVAPTTAGTTTPDTSDPAVAPSITPNSSTNLTFHGFSCDDANLNTGDSIAGYTTVDALNTGGTRPCGMALVYKEDQVGATGTQSWDLTLAQENSNISFVIKITAAGGPFTSDGDITLQAPEISATAEEVHAGTASIELGIDL